MMKNWLLALSLASARAAATVPRRNDMVRGEVGAHLDHYLAAVGQLEGQRVGWVRGHLRGRGDARQRRRGGRRRSFRSDQGEGQKRKREQGLRQYSSPYFQALAALVQARR